MANAKKSCANLNIHACYRSEGGRDRDLRECFCGTANDAIGKLTDGCEIFGFTKGQFSLVDIITAILSQTGPARVDISTWTAASADIRHCYQFVQSGKVHSTRWVVDRSFPTRQPEYFDSLVDRFGADSVRVTRTHAKYCLIDNQDWDIVLRSSMNLNKNPRFENFEISDDPGLADYFRKVTDAIFEQDDVGDTPTTREVDDHFEQVEVLGETYDENNMNCDPLTL